jgi:hypothetical protein
MGKVGSSSIRNTLLLQGLSPVLHLHTFSPLRDKEPGDIDIEDEYRSAVEQEIEHAREAFRRFPWWRKVDWTLREAVHEKRLYRAIVASGKPLKIISVVREPIGANVSMFFQLIDHYIEERYDPSRFSTQSLIDLFLERYSCYRPLIWFDEEFKFATGIDVYREPFDREAGHTRFQVGNREVLILKLETPDEVKERAIAEFVGLEDFRLQRSNVAQQKDYGDQYADFKQSIRFSPEFLRTMYDSKYTRHFYTGEEIEGFRSRWHAQATDQVADHSA